MRHTSMVIVVLLLFSAGCVSREIAWPQSVHKMEILYHGHLYEANIPEEVRRNRDTPCIYVRDGDVAFEEVKAFFVSNRTGWRKIWKQFGLAETVPSIEVYGYDDKIGNGNRIIDLAIWRNDAIISFNGSDLSLKRSITDGIHDRLVREVRKMTPSSVASPVR